MDLPPLVFRWSRHCVERETARAKYFSDIIVHELYPNDYAIHFLEIQLLVEDDPTFMRYSGLIESHSLVEKLIVYKSHH